MLSKSNFSHLARCATNPPAKVSPAPVGSKTSSNNKAGIANTFPSSKRSAPCSPFLMITYL